MGQLLTFAGAELRYHLRRPVNYIFMFLMALGGWLYTATPIAWVGGFGGAVENNAPFKLHAVISFMCMFGTVFTPAIAGTALLRDFESRTHELLFTTRLRKSNFVLGRLLGALLVTILVLSCSAIGLWLGAHMPWVDPVTLGPDRLASYLWPVLVFVVPNAILTCAIFVAVGVLSRSFLAVYTAGIALFVARQLGQSLISGAIHTGPQTERLVALLDPFGLTASHFLTQHWTIDQKNTELVGLVGHVLWNRGLWLAVAAIVLLGAYRLFRMEAFPGVRRRASPKDEPIGDPFRELGPIPPATPRTGRVATWAAFTAMTRLYFVDVVNARAFKAIVVILLLFLVHVVELNFQMMITHPVTHVMAQIVQEFGLFFSILLAVYAGQLIWRERDLGCAPIHDATPVSSVAVIAAKIAALLLIEVVLLFVLVGFGVASQAIAGYTRFEPAVYLGHLHGIELARHTLTIFLAVALQLLVRHKAVGIALLVMYLVLMGMFSDLGVEHRLLRYADLPKIVYSDMNGFGPKVWMFVVMSGYYAAFGMILLALGRLLVVRGAPDGLRARLRVARARATGAWWRFFGLAVAVWLGLGAYAGYNFHVLNTYVDRRSKTEISVAYEREYKQYDAQPQPQPTAIDIHVDVFPEAGRWRARGTYRLENPYEVAIETLHIYTPAELTLHGLEISGGATLEREEPRIRHQIWRLAAPLAPGATMTVDFDVGAENRGFAHGDRAAEVHANGLYVFNESPLPNFGYQRGAEVGDPDERRRLGLPARHTMREFDDPFAEGGPAGRQVPAWVDLSTSVCTAPDQIAVAAGSLVREWEQDGRRCFAYVADAKVVNIWVLLSGRFTVARDRHAGVDLEIYHHPTHTFNIERMFKSMKRSLDYFQANFGPYQFRQVRIVEFPRYFEEARALQGTIPFSESIGFILKHDPGGATFDRPFWITAHEVAHQWWGHQVTHRNVLGGTMAIESLAEYSAIMVSKHEYGLDEAKRMLRESLQNYLRGRSQERNQELPLARNDNQPHIHYSKGLIAFYGLADLVGEDVLNAALARYVRTYGLKGPPMPTADDLLRIVREATPPQYQYYITDAFETITLYDNRVCDASVTEEGGRFRVRFGACARKVRADGVGRETPTAMTDYIDVGVFAAPGPGEFLVGRPLLLEKRVFTSKSADDLEAVHNIEVVIDERPAFVGIDPYGKLIDGHPDDNIAPL